jgi:hypothetical protein
LRWKTNFRWQEAGGPESLTGDFRTRGVFALAQGTICRFDNYPAMAAFLYRCPNTGQLVQGWSAEEASGAEGDADAFETITCLACARPHLVNRATGKVLGASGDQASS